MFEAEWELQSLGSTTKKYSEHVLIRDSNYNKYPVALVHIDTFWPGGRENLPINQFAIHDALNEGHTVKVRVRFDIIEE